MVSSSFLAGVTKRPTFSGAQRSDGQYRQPLSLISIHAKQWLFFFIAYMQPYMYRNIPGLRYLSVSFLCSWIVQK